MDFLLSLIPGGPTGFLAGLAAALAAVVYAFIRGRRAGLDSARAKEADAYERHLEDIARAHDARNRVDPGRLPDDDRYRRD